MAYRILAFVVMLFFQLMAVCPAGALAQMTAEPSPAREVPSKQPDGPEQLPSTQDMNQARTEMTYLNSRVVVKIEDGFGYYRHYMEFIHSIMLGQLKGNPCTEEGRQRVERLLQALNVFSRISITCIPTPDGSVVEVNVTRLSMIREILIEASFPILREEILTVLTIRPGMPFDQEKLERQETLIGDYLAKEGYVSPLISMVTVELQPGLVDCRITIMTDRTWFLSSVDIDGVSNIAELTWNNKFRGGFLNFFLPPQLIRFNENKLDKKVKSFQKQRWKKGFCQANITVDAIRRREKTGEVRLDVTIDDGPHYNVSFVGNKAFSSWRLKRRLVIYREGDYLGRGLRTSIQNIIDLYKSKGYADVHIDVADRLEGGESTGRGRERYIKLVIREGPRVLIDKIVYVGNSQRTTKKLKDIVYSREGKPFRANIAELDRQALQADYLRQGFQKVVVKTDIAFDDKTHEATITHTIEEGISYRFGEISIVGLPPELSDDEVEQLMPRSGQPFRLLAAITCREQLSAWISEQGYPHVKISFNQTERDDGTVDVAFTVDAGHQTYLGKIFFIGNFTTSPSVVVRELDMRQGQQFSLQKVWKAEQSVKNIEIFRSSAFLLPGLEERVNPIPILVLVSEKKPWFSEFGAGFETDAGYRGYFRLANRNLFGLNKQIEGSTELRENGEKISLVLRDPRVFWTRTSGILTTTYEQLREPAYNKDELSTTLGFFRTLSPHLSISLSNRYLNKIIQALDDQIAANSGSRPEKLDPALLRTRNVVSVTPGLIWQSRDNYFRPRSGYVVNPSVTWTYGVDGTLDDFMKFDLAAAYYWTPLSWGTVATSLRLGQAYFYGRSNVLPIDERYYLGGTTSVRGFEQDRLLFERIGSKFKAVGADAALSGSLELRLVPFSTMEEIEIPLFIDTGYGGESLGSIKTEDIRESVGSGIRYHTPIGPISLLYAWPLDRRKGEVPGRFHFLIGYSF